MCEAAVPVVAAEHQHVTACVGAGADAAAAARCHRSRRTCDKQLSTVELLPIKSTVDELSRMSVLPTALNVCWVKASNNACIYQACPLHKQAFLLP
jgi:hypothetical protein